MAIKFPIKVKIQATGTVTNPPKPDVTDKEEKNG